jgi:NAD(P)-dependent dehydrogenase (short-subunit alcohol dehydrogenase family)
MGRVAAKRFAREGARVYGCDLNQSENEQTASQIISEGLFFETGPATDLTEPSEVKAWFDWLGQRETGIDVLYANAGAAKFDPVQDISIESWRWVLGRELDSVFLTVQMAWGMLSANSGTVVLVGSTAGIRGSMTNTRLAHTATKGAVIAMTKQLAAEGSVHGIRVNCVSPGMVQTPATENDLLAESHPMKQIAHSIPLGRVGRPDEIVECALFLASPSASYVTGANLVVDGGWSAVLPGNFDSIPEA